MNVLQRRQAGLKREANDYRGKKSLDKAVNLLIGRGQQKGLESKQRLDLRTAERKWQSPQEFSVGGNQRRRLNSSASCQSI